VVAITMEEAFLDLGTTDFNLGDEFVFHDDLQKDGDKIATQGLAQPTGEFPDRFTFPITGGSGKYEGAGGEINVVQQTTRATVTFHLTD
jgi:hypothetical protein